MCFPLARAPDRKPRKYFALFQIGQDVVKRLWDGLNVTLIAYGESGSGKSYTLFGTAENKGLALRIYDDLFYQLEKKRITDKVASERLSRSLGVLAISEKKVDSVTNGKMQIFP